MTKKEHPWGKLGTLLEKAAECQKRWEESNGKLEQVERENMTVTKELVKRLEEVNRELVRLPGARNRLDRG